MSFSASDIDRIKSEDFKKIPDLMVIIRGNLVPANAEDTWNLQRNLNQLEEAFRFNGLKELASWSGKWRENRMVYGNISPAYDGKNTASKFVTSLKAAMQTEAAKDLKLSGYFTLIVETGREPVVTRVIVTGGEVSYEQSEYVWAEPVTA